MTAVVHGRPSAGTHNDRRVVAAAANHIAKLPRFIGFGQQTFDMVQGIGKFVELNRAAFELNRLGDVRLWLGWIGPLGPPAEVERPPARATIPPRGALFRASQRAIGRARECRCRRFRPSRPDAAERIAGSQLEATAKPLVSCDNWDSICTGRPPPTAVRLKMELVGGVWARRRVLDRPRRLFQRIREPFGVGQGDAAASGRELWPPVLAVERQAELCVYEPFRPKSPPVIAESSWAALLRIARRAAGQRL